MSGPIAYGIDFGTTNSLLSVATDDRVDLLAVDADSELMPSVIYLHRQPLRSAGSDAIRQYVNTASAKTRCGSCSLVRYHDGRALTDCQDHAPGSGCPDSRLIGEIKRELADPARDSTHSWARDFDYPDLVATILRSLKQRGDRAVGGDVRRVVIGHPVAFSGSEGPGFGERQRLANARLRVAAERAGFTDVQLLAEPAAAVSLEEDEGIVLAADFGGGTFDVAIIEMTEARGRVLALAGAAIGGEDLDGLLFRYAVFPALGLAYEGRGRVPNRYRSKFGRRSSAVRTLADSGLRPILAELRSEGDRRGVDRLRRIVDNGWVYDLYATVEQAKCRLSEVESTRIQFDRPGVDIDVAISRFMFEQLIENELGLVLDALVDALHQADLEPEQVDIVGCTGGSSQLPAFQRMLAELFGTEKVRRREPYSAIALGLGLYARRLWHE